jgi:hypothetical protein
MDITNDMHRVQLEVEPLSERAWQRVEARIFERLPDGPLRTASRESAGVSSRCKLVALAVASMRGAARRHPEARRSAPAQPSARGHWARRAPGA